MTAAPPMLGQITARHLDDEANVLGALFNPDLAPRYQPQMLPGLFDDPLRRSIARRAIAEVQDLGEASCLTVGRAVAAENGVNQADLAAELDALVDWSIAANEGNVNPALCRLIERRQTSEYQHNCRGVADQLEQGRIGPTEARARMETLNLRHEQEVKSCRAPIESERARHDFPDPTPASELASGEDLEWRWVGYLASGFVTLLTGLWKAGKTTLLAHYLKLCGIGGDLVGSVEATSVLVVAEEGQALWGRRRDDLGLGDHVHFLIRPFKVRPGRPKWEAFVGYLAELVRTRGYGVVILDTFGSVSPLQDENDAAGMLAALLPLHQITEAGAAVLLVHHPRKGDAGEGQASRGSGALPAFVDIIIELRRFDAEQRSDTRRVLTTYSRFEESPAEAVIELGEHGYTFVGSRGDAKQLDRVSVLQEILPTEPPGYTTDEVRAEWDGFDLPAPGKRTIQADLRHGFGLGMWQREGKGKAGSPYRYLRPDALKGSKVVSRTVPLLDARHDMTTSAPGNGELCPAADRDDFEERAAILQFDAEMSRAEAEALAAREMQAGGTA